MRRRLIKQGNNSFTVTLPVDWVREQEVKENAEVQIDQVEGDLLISIPKESKKPQTSIHIDIKDYHERTIRNVLNQGYRKGYEKIILTYSDSSQLDVIQSIVREVLLGFEVVENSSAEGKKVCTVQNIAEPSADKFSVVLRKVFLTIQDEIPSIIQDLTKGPLKRLRDVEETKRLIDNYTNFCRRLVIKNKIGGSKDSYFLYNLISQLSLIYHSLYYLYVFMSKQKKLSFSSSSISYLESAQKAFNLLSESFYKKDINRAHLISLTSDKLMRQLLEDLQASKGIDSVLLYRSAELLRLIGIASVPLFGLIDSPLPELKIAE